MSDRALLIEVRIHDGRYHGLGDNRSPEWPPSPMRLFSALTAGAFVGRWAAEDRAAKDAAFRWLERLPPPVIAAPHAVKGAPTGTYVPNNDIDAVGGDLSRVGEIRGTTKLFHPHIFDAETPILYVWPFEADGAEAETVCALGDRLYALGRGVDMAYARAQIVEAEAANLRLAAHPGVVSRPISSGKGRRLNCPQPGSFDSLTRRHEGLLQRFAERREGRARRTVFRQSGNIEARSVLYGRSVRHLVYELRYDEGEQAGEFYALPPDQGLDLAIDAREHLVAIMSRTFPERAAEAERFIRGRKDASEADKARRLRFLPLPSIGHQHAAQAVRRLAVEIPSGFPFLIDDIDWALTGLNHNRDGEARPWILTPPETDESGRKAEADMLKNYSRPARRWRTVTPAALAAPPIGRRENGGQRVRRQDKAVAALKNALRHAGFDPSRVAASVRQEPYQRHGLPAARYHYEPDPRFHADALYHAELSFAEPVSGPLLIGRGAFLGLGLFEPVGEPPSIHAFALNQDVAPAQIVAVCKALHRAEMSRVRTLLNRREREPLDVFFSGHETDGAPARSGTHDHLFFTLHLASRRLLIVAPHMAGHRERGEGEWTQLRRLDDAMTGLTTLRAGKAGAFKLRALPEPDSDDPLLRASRIWTSATPYVPTRHPKRGEDVEAFVREDIFGECLRRKLPRPQTIDLNLRTGPKGGLSADARLRFAAAVAGPILLGRASHTGGGLFEAAP